MNTEFRQKTNFKFFLLCALSLVFFNFYSSTEAAVVVATTVDPEPKRFKLLVEFDKKPTPTDIQQVIHLLKIFSLEKIELANFTPYKSSYFERLFELQFQLPSISMSMSMSANMSASIHKIKEKLLQQKQIRKV